MSTWPRFRPAHVTPEDEEKMKTIWDGLTRPDAPPAPESAPPAESPKDPV